jgi:cytochrome c-type biogenesis protein CcmH/NrfF
MTKKQKTPFINLANTREEEQKLVMKNIADAKHCPFCREKSLQISSAGNS